MSLKSLLNERQFILFGGKGGVGKTTCACASAVKFAQEKKKTVLLFSTDPAHSLSDSLEQVLTNEPQAVGGLKNFHALEINAEKTWKDFKEEYGDEIREIFQEGTYLEDQEVDEFFELSIPGLDEIMGLKRITDFIEEKEYDCYVLDSAPTGHTLRLLALPDVLDEWVKVLAKLRWKYRYMTKRFAGEEGETAADRFLLDMKKTVKHVRDLLTDPERTEFVAVTIPEAMGVLETERMLEALHVFHVPTRHIVINNIVPKLQGSAFLEKRRELQEKYVRELKRTLRGYEFTEVEQEEGEVKGLKKLERFSKKLF